MLSRVLLNVRLVWLVVEFPPPVQQDWQQRLPQQEQTGARSLYPNQVFVYCSMSVGQVSPARQFVAVSIHLAFFFTSNPSRTPVVVPDLGISSLGAVLSTGGNCRSSSGVTLTQFLRRLARTSLGLRLFGGVRKSVQVQSDGPENICLTPEKPENNG